MSPRRRAQGEGGIYYEAARDRYRGEFDAGRTPDGKRRRIRVTGQSRAEVAEKIRARRAELATADRATPTLTVAELIDQWAAATLHTMTPKTAEQYRWSISHLRPGLGHHRATHLRIEHVEAFLAERAGKGLGLNSVKRLRTNLRRILRWAERRGSLARNVADLADLPAATPPKRGVALGADQVRDVIEAASYSRLEALWLLYLGTGLRPGEATGLRWPDVDLDSGTVTVNGVLKWDDDDRPYLGDVKTPKSQRTLILPSAVVTALRAHRARQAAERLAGTWPDQWADLVFVSSAGTPLMPTNVRRDLNRVLADAGLQHVRPYDLRHSAASLLAAAGVPLEDIADVLGHTGLDVAREVYVHSRGRPVAAAARTLDQVPHSSKGVS